MDNFKYVYSQDIRHVSSYWQNKMVILLGHLDMMHLFLTLLCYYFNPFVLKKKKSCNGYFLRKRKTSRDKRVILEK